MFTHPIATVLKCYNWEIPKAVIPCHSGSLTTCTIAHGHANFEICNRISSWIQKRLRNCFSLLLCGPGSALFSRKYFKAFKKAPWIICLPCLLHALGWGQGRVMPVRWWRPPSTLTSAGLTWREDGYPRPSNHRYRPTCTWQYSKSISVFVLFV